MITVEQIRLKLQEGIKRSGMTQTEIAQKIGVCQQTIAHYLHQNKMPALDTFANLCAVLDLDPADILCISDYNAPARSAKYNIGTFNNNGGNVDMK